MENWDAHVERESRRFRDGLERLPQDPDPRQKQLVRMANAAAGAGLACLMAERADEARSWFLEAAARYRESHADAPPGSWGRPIGSVKMRLLGGDVAGAVEDARWTLSLAPARSESPIGRYAAVLASLVLGDDDTAAELVGTLRAETEDRFPRPVADALAGLAARDAATYEDGVRRTLRLLRGACGVPGGRPRRGHRSRTGSSGSSARARNGALLGAVAGIGRLGSAPLVSSPHRYSDSRGGTRWRTTTTSGPTGGR